MLKIVIPVDEKRVEAKKRLERIEQNKTTPPTAPTTKNILQAITDLTQEVLELKRMIDNK